MSSINRLLIFVLCLLSTNQMQRYKHLPKVYQTEVDWGLGQG